MEDKKLIYELVIYRKGIEPLNVLQSEDFSVVKAMWKDLTDKWAFCIEKRAPFSVEEPILISFDPGLIYEIKVNLIKLSVSDVNNPYTKQMVSEGFSKTMLNLNPVLDQGYKYN